MATSSSTTRTSSDCAAAESLRSHFVTVARTSLGLSSRSSRPAATKPIASSARSSTDRRAAPAHAGSTRTVRRRAGAWSRAARPVSTHAGGSASRSEGIGRGPRPDTPRRPPGRPENLHVGEADPASISQPFSGDGHDGVLPPLLHGTHRRPRGPAPGVDRGGLQRRSFLLDRARRGEGRRHELPRSRAGAGPSEPAFGRTGPASTTSSMNDPVSTDNEGILAARR
jgi:hypothetical protein